VTSAALSGISSPGIPRLSRLLDENEDEDSNVAYMSSRQ
jgi:hypothetical protein